MLLNYANQYAQTCCNLRLLQAVDDIQYKGLAARGRQVLDYLHIAMHGLLSHQGLLGLQMLGRGRLIRCQNLIQAVMGPYFSAAVLVNYQVASRAVKQSAPIHHRRPCPLRR